MRFEAAQASLEAVAGSEVQDWLAEGEVDKAVELLGIDADVIPAAIQHEIGQTQVHVAAVQGDDRRRQDPDRRRLRRPAIGS